MSRAFIKEDLEQPELEKPAAFRAFRMVGLDEVEANPTFSSDDVFAVIAWATSRPSGAFMVRDADGVKLAEIT
jgi:hypothetical protein